MAWESRGSIKGPQGADGGTTPHHTRHSTGGDDPLTAADIGAAAAAHTHASADVNSGTLAIGRIPTGTTGTTVSLGDHNHDTRYYTESEVDTSLSGKANTVHTHAAADVNSGTLDIARIPTGTSGTTVSLGNHTHAATAITSGTLSNARLPSVLSAVRTVAFAASTTLDPAVAGNLISITATGDITSLAVTTTGATDRQKLECAVLASAATRAVTIAAAVRTSTAITRGPYSIPSGQVGVFLFEYFTLVSAWVLVSALVSAT